MPIERRESGRNLADFIREIRNGEKTEQLTGALGQKALEISRNNWIQGRSPDGDTWKRGRKLRRSDKMFESLSVKQAKTKVILQVDAAAKNGAKYSVTHQFGKTIKAKTKYGLRFKIDGKWRNKKTVYIPQRPTVPLPRSIPEEFEREFTKEAEKILNGQ